MKSNTTGNRLKTHKIKAWAWNGYSRGSSRFSWFVSLMPSSFIWASVKKCYLIQRRAPHATHEWCHVTQQTLSILSLLFFISDPQLWLQHGRQQRQQKEPFLQHDGFHGGVPQQRPERWAALPQRREKQANLWGLSPASCFQNKSMKEVWGEV